METKMTNFKLTDSERKFLAKCGKGKMANGLRALMAVGKNVGAKEVQKEIPTWERVIKWRK